MGWGRCRKTSLKRKQQHARTPIQLGQDYRAGSFAAGVHKCFDPTHGSYFCVPDSANVKAPDQMNGMTAIRKFGCRSMVVLAYCNPAAHQHDHPDQRRHRKTQAGAQQRHKRATQRQGMRSGQASTRLRVVVLGRPVKFRSTSIRSAALIRDW